MMDIDPQLALGRFVGALVDGLMASGARHFVICPGSRSTPLALTIAQHPGAKYTVLIDERSAGFYALGMARVLAEPVVLLCTSGTAAANFLPALAEAQLSRIPLIVLTADRPHELRDNGAPQTINQIGLYGSVVKWFFEMPLPEGDARAVAFARTIAARAVATSLEAPAGPVHLNCPFREPLVPRFDAQAEQRPTPGVQHGRRQLGAAAISTLARELRSVERGLLVCGPQDDAVLAPALADLSAALGWPLLADPISQLRCGPHHHALIIDSYDAFLRDEAFVHANPPELIVRFGAMPTAKPFLQYVQRNPACRLLVVDGGAGWNEPTSQATDVIYADPVELCRALVAELLGALERGSGGAGRQIENSASSAFSAVQTGESAWASVWMRAQQVTRATLAAALLASDEIFEGRVFAELGSLLPVGATLYVGNSMPIRDCDTFLAGGTKALRLLGNRGANGIDGVVSSALGAAAAGATPLTLVIGDLSLYHDSNGLLAAKQQGLNATIVLLNNEGGGIFSFLPQAAERDHFEVLFGTPSGLDFRHLAALYGAQYCQPQSWAAFRAALLTSWATPGLHLIELRTNREHNVAQHRTLWPLVSAALASL